MTTSHVPLRSCRKRYQNNHTNIESSYGAKKKNILKQKPLRITMILHSTSALHEKPLKSEAIFGLVLFPALDFMSRIGSKLLPKRAKLG